MGSTSEHLNEKANVAGSLYLHQEAELAYACVHTSSGRQINLVGEALDGLFNAV